jgi:hypothetical protein
MIICILFTREEKGRKQVMKEMGRGKKVSVRGIFRPRIPRVANSNQRLKRQARTDSPSEPPRATSSADTLMSDI